MTLEIKDKEPKIHENDMSKPKKKINKNYRLPALSLLKILQQKSLVIIKEMHYLKLKH